MAEPSGGSFCVSHKWFWMILFAQMFIWQIVTSQEYGSDIGTNPLILWWYDSLFPHIEEEGKTIYNTECNGVTCRTSSNRNFSSNDEFQAIIFYGSDFQPYDVPLPRKKNQMWALLHEESPQNNYILCQPETLKLFNFSSTFKQQSDYPLTTQHIHSIHYLLGKKPLSIKEKNKYRREGLAPIVYLQSHCDVPSDRDRYVKELQKFIKVDSFGKCLHNKDFRNGKLADTNEMESEELYSELAKYKFHLAFENAICDDYITEKLYRAFHVGSVPVYRGARNAKEWSPSPTSIIMADDFKSPGDLAKLLNLLDTVDESYARFLDYKKDVADFNPKLKEVLESRPWSTEEPEALHFVQGFECSVCEQMHKMQKLLSSGGTLASRTLSPAHLSCPQPKPSVGGIETLSMNDGFHKWTEDFLLSAHQAYALRDVIANNETDPESLWHYTDLYMIKELPKHAEL